MRKCQSLTVGDLELGGPDTLYFIAGPDVAESLELCLRLAERLARFQETHGAAVIFKSSFDKANRSSWHSYRGPGLEEGLRILEAVKRETGLPLITDVHETHQVEAVGQVVDVIQIPAFLCRQTDLIAAAAGTGRLINLKKGQFLAPWDMVQAIDKARQAGAEGLMVTERGTMFGYNNLVSDFKGIPVLRQAGAPVVFDATHSLQLPGGRGDRTGGERQHIPVLARAAVVAGVDGIFSELHPEPREARVDRETVITPDEFEALGGELLALRRFLARRGPVAFEAIDF